MDKIIGYVIIFFIIFIVMVIAYYLNLKLQSNKIKKGGIVKLPTDMRLFLVINKLDIKELNKKKLNFTMAVLNGLNIATVFLLTEITTVLILKVIIAIVAAFAIIFASYKLVGKFFK